VVDVLSRKSRDVQIDFVIVMNHLAQQFAIVHIDNVLTGELPILAALVVQSLTITRIKLVQRMILSCKSSWMKPDVEKHLVSISPLMGF